MEKQEPCRIVGESMYFELKENKPHGTKDNPFSIYHIENAGRSFQIPVHWHDEFEIIYVKSGLLTVSISGESYIGKAGGCVRCIAGQSASYGLTDRHCGLFYIFVSVKIYIFSDR